MPDYVGKQSRLTGAREIEPAGTGEDRMARLSPGKRTLVEQAYPDGMTTPLPPSEGQAREPPPEGNRPPIQALFGGAREAIQRRAAAGGDGAGKDVAAIHASAQRGIATPATQLPHHDVIQRAFGRHDISSIQAHTSPGAAASAREIGAQAYAMGSHVVVGSSPDLFTMAHEAAHVVQQRGGVHCSGGVGEVNDVYERHADEVAALVVQGKSAEAALDRYAGGGDSAAPVGHGATVQRKVGFEAELSVPSFGPAPSSVDSTKLAPGPNGGNATPAIQQFLFGGLDYGENRGEDAHFTLKPDHNVLQTKMRALWTKLGTMGVLRTMPTVATSNLEYVTKPIDELSLNSTLAFDRQFAAIQKHVNAMFPTARTAMLPVGAPGVETYTGVPLNDLQTWLGTDYAQIAGLVADFQASVKNELYLQATVGIIPSAIRELHRDHAATLPQGGALETAMTAVDTAIDDLVASDDFQNDPYVQAMRNGKDEKGWFGSTVQKPARPIDYEAFVGVLHLMLMYMVGSALNQTRVFQGASRKNAVPFMSKMANMRYIITSAAPGLQANRPPKSLISYLDQALRAVEATQVSWWVSKGLQKAQPGQDERAATVNNSFVSDMLAGNKLLPESIFGGNQVRTMGSPRNFDAPDQLPDEVSQASAGQQAAQFEYRWITARPSADGLAAELKKVVDEVRKLNLKHMPHQRRHEMLDEAEHGRPDETYIYVPDL